MVIKTPVNENLTRVKAALDEFGVGYLELEPEDIKRYQPNVTVAAQAKGADFLFKAEVAAVLKKDGRTAGVGLTDGLNVGFYSRNRKINTDSSFSVIDKEEEPMGSRGSAWYKFTG